MSYIKLFEEFLNEGAIFVYPPGDPYEKERSIQWPGLLNWIKIWDEEGQRFMFVCDVDYDKYNANPKYRSLPLGTERDKTLPLFSEENPNYDEVDFDLVEVVPFPEKPREPWLKIQDKNGVQFMIPPVKVLEVQKGDSAIDGIHSGTKFLIDKMRGEITNYKDDNIIVKMQDGSRRVFKLDEWKKANFTEIEENARFKMRKSNNVSE